MQRISEQFINIKIKVIQSMCYAQRMETMLRNFQLKTEMELPKKQFPYLHKKGLSGIIISDVNNIFS